MNRLITDRQVVRVHQRGPNMEVIMLYLKAFWRALWYSASTPSSPGVRRDSIAPGKWNDSIASGPWRDSV